MNLFESYLLLIGSSKMDPENFGNKDKNNK